MGGRIAFGADGRLFLSIGDTDVPDLAQDPNELEGSILRYNPDGSIPDDNPIPGSPVYAIGLRNVFGLAIQPGTGFLYATDNGPGGFDEVNRVEAGHNYGWPLHFGVRHAEGISDPIAVFGNYPLEQQSGPPVLPLPRQIQTSCSSAPITTSTCVLLPLSVAQIKRLKTTRWFFQPIAHLTSRTAAMGGSITALYLQSTVPVSMNYCAYTS